MTDRAHLVTKYVCEYGRADFSYAADEVYELLTDSGVEIEESDDYCHQCEWEIQCEDNAEALRKCVAKLEKLKPDRVNRYFKDIEEEDSRYTNAEVVSTLKDWLQHMDEEANVIRVHWF